MEENLELHHYPRYSVFNIFNKKRGLLLIGNNNKINKREKNPGIELLRLLGMYAIIVHHVLLFGNTFKKYKHFKVVFLMNILCFWHVSSYALISGIVGYKTYKYSNLLYLWISTVFYSVVIYLYYKRYHPMYFENHTLIESLFPVIFHKYWYFTAYFGMYLFIPLINKGLSVVNKKELKIIVVSIFGIFIILKDFIKSKFDPFGLKRGYSVLNLIIFYILGAYLGKYVIKGNKNKSIFYYLICLLVYISSSLLCYYFCCFFNKEKAKIKILINVSQLFTLRINSFAMILQVISLTLIFTQIKYNKIFGKIVSCLGPYTYGVYISHCNEYFINFEFIKIFENYSEFTPLNTIVYLVNIRSIQIYILCIFIDYIRYLFFKILKIREICIFIDKQINNLF